METYGKRSNRTVLPPLQQQTQSKQLNILQAGVKQSHPAHIPSYLPPFPDPHAYIRTPVKYTTLCGFKYIDIFSLFAKLVIHKS